MCVCNPVDFSKEDWVRGPRTYIFKQACHVAGQTASDRLGRSPGRAASRFLCLSMPSSLHSEQV